MKDAKETPGKRKSSLKAGGDLSQVVEQITAMKDLITELGQNQQEVNKLIRRDDYLARLSEKAPEPAYKT